MLQGYIPGRKRTKMISRRPLQPNKIPKKIIKVVLCKPHQEQQHVMQVADKPLSHMSSEVATTPNITPPTVTIPNASKNASNASSNNVSKHNNVEQKQEMESTLVLNALDSSPSRSLSPLSPPPPPPSRSPSLLSNTTNKFCKMPENPQTNTTYETIPKKQQEIQETKERTMRITVLQSPEKRIHPPKKRTASVSSTSSSSSSSSDDSENDSGGESSSSSESNASHVSSSHLATRRRSRSRYSRHSRSRSPQNKKRYISPLRSQSKRRRNSSCEKEQEGKTATVADMLNMLREDPTKPLRKFEERKQVTTTKKNFTIVQKEFKRQQVLIIAKGLEKAASATLEAQGYNVLHFKQIFENVGAQLALHGSNLARFAEALESSCSCHALYNYFYHWSCTSKNRGAKLAITNVTGKCTPSIQRLEKLGARYIQSWPQENIQSLPLEFCWKLSSASSSVGNIWNATEKDQKLHTIKPRDGWSTGGTDMVIILLGGTEADINILLGCGCWLYSEMWFYEQIATNVLQQGFEAPVSNILICQFAVHIRNLLRKFQQDVIIPRFEHWWQQQQQRKKHHIPKQVILHGLDAVVDANEITALQQMNAAVFSRIGSLTACEVTDIDFPYKNEHDLKHWFKQLFHSKQTPSFIFKT